MANRTVYTNFVITYVHASPGHDSKLPERLFYVYDTTAHKAATDRLPTDGYLLYDITADSTTCSSYT